MYISGRDIVFLLGVAAFFVGRRVSKHEKETHYSNGEAFMFYVVAAVCVGIAVYGWLKS